MDALGITLAVLIILAVLAGVAVFITAAVFIFRVLDKMKKQQDEFDSKWNKS